MPTNKENYIAALNEVLNWRKQLTVFEIHSSNYTKAESQMVERIANKYVNEKSKSKSTASNA